MFSYGRTYTKLKNVQPQPSPLPGEFVGRKPSDVEFQVK